MYDLSESVSKATRAAPLPIRVCAIQYCRKVSETSLDARNTMATEKRAKARRTKKSSKMTRSNTRRLPSLLQSPKISRRTRRRKTRERDKLQVKPKSLSLCLAPTLQVGWRT